MPFIKTYKFLSNQTRNLENSLQSKFDSGVCVIVGSTTGLGVLYAKYLRTLNFSHFVLIDKDETLLLQQKKGLCVKAKEKPKIFTIKFDLTGKLDLEKLKQI
jgi:short-subunit dehydrogenase